MNILSTKGEVMATVDGNHLDHMDFSGATMREANFEGANLREVLFCHANLEMARFVNADLTDARLDHANLRYAVLNGAKLVEADLTNAALNPCEMRDTDLRGADLRGADLHGAQLGGAKYDQTTTWPADFDPRAAGAVSVEASAADGLIQKANGLLRERHADQAISMLKAALWDHPRHAGLHQSLGRAHALAGQLDEAYQQFHSALQLDPYAANVHCDLAVLFCKVGLPSLAREHLERALHMDARNEKAKTMLLRLRSEAES